LLQGDAGYSRKGPQPRNASFYYSQPQLRVEAELTRDGRTQRLTGSGWLDHEWSSTLLEAETAGWDWIGMNLADGSALTAFQLRRRDGRVHFGYASLRTAGDKTARVFAPDEVVFTPIQTWTSPRTRATWPVAQRVRVGSRIFTTQPLLPDQELDSRATTGAVYWEGASRLHEKDDDIGRGYLEMTGYVAPILL